MKIRLLHILFIFSMFSVFGQDKTELKSLIVSDSISEDKIKHLLQLSGFYSRTAIDSSMLYVRQAEILANEVKNDSITSKLRAHKAGILIINKEYEAAEKLLNQNIAMSTIDSLTLGETYLNIGNIYFLKQDFEPAVNYYLKSSEIFEVYKDTSKLGRVYANIGAIQSKLKNSEKAILNLKNALAYLNDNELLKMQVLANLAAAYNENGKVEKAINTSLESEKLAKKNNAMPFLGLIYSNLSNFYLINKEYNVSIDYGLKGLEIKKKLNQNSNVILNNIGYAYLQQENNDQALSYFNKILPTATGELKPLLYNNLRKTYENIGNYKEALKFANQYNVVQDSLNLLKQRQQVDEITEKYQSEKKQQQIDLLKTKDELNLSKLKAQKNFIWALAIFSLLVIALGFLFYRNQKTNLSLQTSKIRHRLLQTQLNPHFLFHALSSIQGYIYQNKKEESVGYLSSFSKLMRSILNSSDQDFITVEEDINALKDYLHLQKLNLDKAFKEKLVIDDQIDDSLLIPPMFTQPFVENALSHGMKDNINGFIHIEYKIDNNSIFISIQDNGSGYKKDSIDINKLNRSMSMEILNNRVQNLKKTHKYNCSIVTNSTKEGTTVKLKFPIRYKKL